MKKLSLLFACVLSVLGVQAESETQWVQNLLQEYPELVWLANKKVWKTEEATARKNSGSWSEKFYGEKLMELDRTLLGLRCMHHFVLGTEEGYAALTADQKKEKKMSYESFIQVHTIAKKLCTNIDEGEHALKAALIFGDMGKTEHIRELTKKSGHYVPDFNELWGIIMRECPDILPTYKTLSAKTQKLLQKSAYIAHFGHITHIEGGPQMFTRLKQSNMAKDDPVALDLAFFIQVCDVSGALGHVSHNSSLVYTQQVHDTMMAIKHASEQLKDKDETGALNYYITQRAQWLGLDAENKTEKVLTRVGAMLRLYMKEEGQQLRAAFAQLSKADQELVVEQLSGEVAAKDVKTPTYVPALLVNLANSASLDQAVTIGLPFVAQVLKEKRNSGNNPLCFNAAAGVARDNFAQLKARKFTIDDENNVIVGE